MVTAMPNAAVLRAMSDETVVRALLDAGRATRAELATSTGLSKPTVAQSVRRLESKGLVRDTGERTAGRGGVGSYYAPAGAAAGVALAVALAPEGIVVETLGATGSCLARVERPVGRPSAAPAVRRLLGSAARRALSGVAGGRAEVAAVSAADPVDRASGRLVQLPDAPFLVGDLDPSAVLSAVVDGPVLVDNDVNWAARHEYALRSVEDFAYLYLGDGLGCAIVSDGQVRRGHGGLAGEIAHLVTSGPNGRALPFIAVFAELGLQQPRATAIDFEAITAALEHSDTLNAVSRAVADVVGALVALGDPATVVLAGSWGVDPRLLDAVRVHVDAAPRRVPVDVAHDPRTAALAGVRSAAVDSLRERIAAAAVYEEGAPRS